MYLPHCAETNSEHRNVAAQVSDWQAALRVGSQYQFTDSHLYVQMYNLYKYTS